MALQSGAEADTRAASVFEDRYGEGAYARLLEWLARPCVTFAQIARHFGVSRERARQWHRQLLPDAPGGRERRRQCALQRRRRRMLSDEVFRMFIQQARAHVGAARVQPIRSRTGYRRGEVLLDGRLVALRDHAGRPGAERGNLLRYRGRAEFVFVRTAPGDFVFLRTGSVTISPAWRNSFAAMSDFDEDDRTGPDVDETVPQCVVVNSDTCERRD